MTTALVARGMTIAIALLFLVAVAHKVRVLRDGRAQAEPMIRTAKVWARRPRLSLSAAALSELSAVGLLLVAPVAGLATGAGLVAFYISQLLRLPDDVPCNCFGAGLRSPTRAEAITRNVALAAVAGGLAVAMLAGLTVSDDWAASAATALAILAPLAGTIQLRRTLPTTGTAIDHESSFG